MKTIRLQGCKKTAVIGWMAGMLLLAGCTQDKLADATQGEMLPEGKYPVTFIATGLGMSATTRATAEGEWNTDDEVAVQVENESAKKYKPSSSGSGVTLTATDPFYWQSTSNINVTAWYFGTGYQSSLPTTWSVKTDQSGNGNNNGYQKSDFLYAPQTAIDFKGTKSLTFYHQTAKVVVNIRNYGVATDAEKIASITINAVADGDFNTTLTENCGLSAKNGASPSEIKSFKLTEPNNVSFGGAKENALASYQALVIPQNLKDNTSIEIKINGYNTFKYPLDRSWKGGTQYTYNLTIEGSEVTATVTPSSMEWTNGATGSGSVDI